MWDKRSYLLHPVTLLTSNKVNSKCTDVEHKASDDIKCAVAQDTLLAYPDLNKYFDIHTDVSKYQLVSVIIHNSKIIDFYSRKLAGP